MNAWTVLAALPLACGDDLPDALVTADGSTSVEVGSSTGAWGLTDPIPLPTTQSPLDTGSEGSTTIVTTATTTATTDDGASTTMGVDPTTTTVSLTSHGSSSVNEEGSHGSIPVEPTAHDDVACTVRGLGVLEIADVTANDTDPQGSALTIVAVDAATARGGTAALMGDSIFYTVPAPEFWGEDWLSYTIEDPEGNQDSAELHIMVWPGTMATGEIDAGLLGVTIWPEANNGRVGSAVHGGGSDFNGDGFDDVVVSAPFSQGSTGRAYVVYGGPEVPTVDLNDVEAGVGGFALYGEHPNAYTGWSLSALPDLDGDGRDEVVVGSGWVSINGGQSGRVYVVFGPAVPASLQLSDLEISGGGYIIEGTGDGSWAGFSVSAVPDMNGDGLFELLVGSPYDFNLYPDAPGWVYVVWGKDTTTPVALLDLQGGLLGGFGVIGQAGDHIGFAAHGLDDLDGDGLGDLVVGTEYAVNQAGRAYVVHGKADEAPLDLAAALLGPDARLVEGAVSGDVLGRSVAQVGDLDGNGRPEVLVGAPADPGTGAAHIIYDSVSADLVIGTLAPDEGVSLASLIADDRLGWSVSSIGDFNLDGWDDLAIAAPHHEFAPGSESGQVYVIFGRPDLGTVVLSDIAEGRGGFVFVGDEWLQGTGWSVSSAGDFNGDGADDLLVGAATAGPMGPDGRAYVVYGVSSSTPELGACIPPAAP